MELVIPSEIEDSPLYDRTQIRIGSFCLWDSLALFSSIPTLCANSFSVSMKFKSYFSEVTFYDLISEEL